jgi:hypothetical protein
MAVHDHIAQHDQLRRSFLASSTGLVLICFVLIAGVLLLTEHRAHVLGALVYLPLLLCPLMHFFMHGRHGGYGADQERRVS